MRDYRVESLYKCSVVLCGVMWEAISGGSRLDRSARS